MGRRHRAACALLAPKDGGKEMGKGKKVKKECRLRRADYRGKHYSCVLWNICLCTYYTVTVYNIWQFQPRKGLTHVHIFQIVLVIIIYVLWSLCGQHQYIQEETIDVIYDFKYFIR